MGRHKLPAEKVEAVLGFLAAGMNPLRAADAAGVSKTWAYTLDRQLHGGMPRAARQPGRTDRRLVPADSEERVRGLLAVAAVAAGFTTDVYRPASSALVADLVPDPDRARAYGLLFWIVNLGTSAAMVLGGLLARTGYSALFWTDAATCAAFGLLVWRLIPETLPRARPAGARVAGQDASGPSPRPAGVLGDPLMIAFTLLTLLVMCVYMQAFSSLPLAMERSGLSPQAYGQAMALNGLVIVVAQPILGTWLARRDTSAVIASGIVALGVGYGLLSLAASAWEYAACVAIWTIGEILFTSIAPAVVASLAPPLLRGQYSGMFGTAFSVGYLIAPLAGTRLLAAGKPVLWLACAGACALAALAQLALGPAIHRRATVTSAAAP